MTFRRACGVLAPPFLLFGGLAAAALVFRALPTGGSGLGEWARRQGPAGFFLAGAIACAVGVPRQAVAFSAGYAYGPWAGGFLALAAETAGCLADVVWARAVARRWVRRRFGHRLVRLDRLLLQRPLAATVSLRLLPVGNNVLLSFAAGVSVVPVLPFLAGSCIGYVPQTVVFAMLGGGMAVGAWVQLAMAVVLFMVSTVIGVMVLRAGRNGDDEGQGFALDPPKGGALWKP